MQGQRFTSSFDGNRDGRVDGTAIDHILVSKGLWDIVSEVDIVHEAPAGVDGELLSDHWPIYVTFGAAGAEVRTEL